MASKVKCKHEEYNKTVNICGMYSSLEEAFELSWSALADGHNTLPKSTSKHKIEQLIYVISMEFLSLSRRVPSGQERGETAVFAGYSIFSCSFCCIVRFKFLLVMRIHTYILIYWHLGHFLN